MENNIDTVIYMSQLQPVIEPMIQDLVEEYDIDDIDKFKELLNEELEFICAENVLQYQSPTLDESQFMSVLSRCIATYYLDQLSEGGFITKQYDPELNDTVFSLTDKGEERAKQYKL